VNSSARRWPLGPRLRVLTVRSVIKTSLSNSRRRKRSLPSTRWR